LLAVASHFSLSSSRLSVAESTAAGCGGVFLVQTTCGLLFVTGLLRYCCCCEVGKPNPRLLLTPDPAFVVYAETVVLGFRAEGLKEKF
jgi:hypothetical protein